MFDIAVHPLTVTLICEVEFVRVIICLCPICSAAVPTMGLVSCNNTAVCSTKQPGTYLSRHPSARNVGSSASRPQRLSHPTNVSPTKRAQVALPHAVVQEISNTSEQDSASVDSAFVNPSRPVRVLIAGGGIAGLVLAVALLKKGVDVRVYEQDMTAIRGEGKYRGPIQVCSASAMLCLYTPNMPWMALIFRVPSSYAPSIHSLPSLSLNRNVRSGPFAEVELLPAMCCHAPGQEWMKSPGNEVADFQRDVLRWACVTVIVVVSCPPSTTGTCRNYSSRQQAHEVSPSNCRCNLCRPPVIVCRYNLMHLLHWRPSIRTWLPR